MMKYIDEFRDQKIVKRLLRQIASIAPSKPVNIMEVCGTHTMSFCRFGLARLIPKNIKLIAGPGCPVCVSSQSYIDQAIALARRQDTIILSFGDMLRVPGTKTSLEKERAEGADVHMVYSPLDSIKIAKNNPDKKVIFLAVGFETTAPTIALSIIAAKKAKIKNLSFFSCLKVMPPPMEAILKDKRINIQGFLCPGHVSAIIGVKPYEFIPKKHKIGCCISGFEPVDMLESIYILLKQIVNKRPKVENQYKRVVPDKGNLRAQKIIAQVFRTADVAWRGLGVIPKSGLQIKKEFAQFDTVKAFNLKKDIRFEPKNTKCRCGDILKGLISPLKCPLFMKACSPNNPIGPCMVSSEGACNAYHKYG